MENRAHALAAGIFVVALSLLLLVLAAWLTRDTGVRDTYEISTKLSVSGLQEQAPVRYRGVDVGKVKTIGFDPKVAGNVLITLQVEREAPVTRDTFAILSFQGVTGLAYVQLDNEGQQAGARLVPNEEAPPRIPLRPGLLAKLEERGEVIIERVEEISARMNNLLNDDNQRRFSEMLVNLGAAADSAQQLADRMGNTVSKRLDPALAEASTTLRSATRTSDEVSRTAAEFGQTARRLNEPGGAIDRIGEGTQSLSHAADSFNTGTLPRINRAVEEAERALRQVRRAANSLNDNPQALVYGSGPVKPGPGEPGFTPPGAPK